MCKGSMNKIAKHQSYQLNTRKWNFDVGMFGFLMKPVIELMSF